MWSDTCVSHGCVWLEAPRFLLLLDSSSSKVDRDYNIARVLCLWLYGYNSPSMDQEPCLSFHSRSSAYSSLRLLKSEPKGDLRGAYLVDKSAPGLTDSLAADLDRDSAGDSNCLEDLISLCPCTALPMLGLALGAMVILCCLASLHSHYRRTGEGNLSIWDSCKSSDCPALPLSSNHSQQRKHLRWFCLHPFTSQGVLSDALNAHHAFVSSSSVLGSN